ncbi:rhodanese-like domain-containing protein [Nitrososphaera viennensis]|uniref:Rhodanese-like domain-containing protein n=1 Tax=Nitrososphaera viennensis TaxID=1034015 RepID=A0A977NLQ5_9ARCH|nr:rhodanese-like domain-containing protein [Nitrososphaera viennensis]UVS68687.1 rhodanese-like domain-containing protein [Nitrososphaera viennensis]
MRKKTAQAASKAKVKAKQKPKAVKKAKPAATTTATKKQEFVQLPIVCDADTLRTLVRKKAVRVVDVRKADDYDAGHIPTAVSLPLARLLEDDKPERVIQLLEEFGITEKMPVVIYDDTFGALAARVAWTFQYVGHTNTALLEMTFKQWKELGLETETKANNYPRSEHPLAINKDIYADAQYVEAAQSQQGKLLVDSRERLNFLTEHIPTARNIPYTMLGANGSILRKADELKRMIENRGIAPDSEIITYCGSVGTLSGLAYYALKLAGYNNVKLYPKSFKEWKSLGKPKDEFKEANYWDLSAE